MTADALSTLNLKHLKPQITVRKNPILNPANIKVANIKIVADNSIGNINTPGIAADIQVRKSAVYL